MSLIFLGATLTFAFNYFYLEHLLIPDPCYYHYRDTTILFDIFYDLPISEGGHPSPTIFNFVFTLAIGALFGWYCTKFYNKWSNDTNNSTQHSISAIAGEE